MDKQLCGYCGIVLRDDYFKCRICGQLYCLECRNPEHKCCVKCVESLDSAKSTIHQSEVSVEPEGPDNGQKRKPEGRPNPAFMRPMTPSDALAAVVGSHALPRTEVTKKVWEYIKKHSLQDPVNRRMINADDTLKKVFGGKNQVNMFEMTALVSKHLS